MKKRVAKKILMNWDEGRYRKSTLAAADRWDSRDTRRFMKALTKAVGGVMNLHQIIFDSRMKAIGEKYGNPTTK